MRSLLCISIAVSSLFAISPAAVSAATLCGTVTNRETGVPVPDAGVFVYLTDGAFTDRYATTDALGAFCVDGLEPGTYDLYVIVDDYLPRWVRDVVLNDAVSVEIPFDGTPALAAPWPNPAKYHVSIRFRARPGEPFSVTIHDAGGRLVKGWRGTGGSNWTILWDFVDQRGRPVPAGFYVICLDMSERHFARPIVCVR